MIWNLGFNPKPEDTTTRFILSTNDVVDADKLHSCMAKVYPHDFSIETYRISNKLLLIELRKPCPWQELEEYMAEVWEALTD